jgi:hypothetical protein
MLRHYDASGYAGGQEEHVKSGSDEEDEDSAGDDAEGETDDEQTEGEEINNTPLILVV